MDNISIRAYTGDGRSNPFNTGRNDFTNGSSDNLKSQKQLEREAIRDTNKTSRYYNISNQKLARS